MEFHIIRWKKVNAWAGISKGGKESILIFTENIIKDLFIKIMDKILKEMETFAGINFEPI